MGIEDFIRNRIIQLINSKNYSERTLSELLGFAHSYLQQITSGKSLPSFQSLQIICDFFEITLSDFFSPQFKDGGTAEFYAAKLNAIENESDRKLIYNILSDLDDEKVKAIRLLVESYAKYINDING